MTNFNAMNRSELKSELADVHATNTRVMPKWRSALDQIFSGEEKLSHEAKAEILGVPTRRNFFRVGGTVLAGAAIVAACGDDDDANVSGDPTTTGAGGDTSTTVAAGAALSVLQPAFVSSANPLEDIDGAVINDDAGLDITLAQTAISLEILAIDTYQAAIDSGLVTTELVGTAAGMFQDHHVQHRGALEGVVSGAGLTPVAEANAAVKTALIDPVLTDPALDEAMIVKLAFDLEAAAAQTYVFAATALSTPELRSTIMTIGGVEYRHAAILNAAGGLNA